MEGSLPSDPGPEASCLGCDWLSGESALLPRVLQGCSRVYCFVWLLQGHMGPDGALPQGQHVPAAAGGGIGRPAYCAGKCSNCSALPQHCLRVQGSACGEANSTAWLLHWMLCRLPRAGGTHWPLPTTTRCGHSETMRAGSWRHLQAQRNRRRKWCRGCRKAAPSCLWLPAATTRLLWWTAMPALRLGALVSSGGASVSLQAAVHCALCLLVVQHLP